MIQSALRQLTQANGSQQNVRFDGSSELAATDSLLASVAVEAAGIAADAAGSDVSATAKRAVNDLENAQSFYSQLANSAEQAGYGQINVTGSVHQVVGSLDQALEMLQSGPPDDHG